MPRQFEKMRMLGGGSGGSGSIPIGSIIFYAGDYDTLWESDKTWLLCNGAIVRKADYPDLADVLSSYYNGSANVGADSFKLPDVQGRTLVGVKTSKGLTLGSANRGVLPVPTGVDPRYFSATANYFYAGQCNTWSNYKTGYPSRAGGVFSHGGATTNGTSGHNHPNRYDQLITMDMTKIFGIIDGEGSLFSSTAEGIIPNCVVCYPIIKAKR